jgi:ABC-type Fe3+/spermidine/putrescine transport system ATPase subunit
MIPRYAVGGVGLPKLQLIDLVKSFGQQQVVRGLFADVAEGQMLVLLGPSGCGKTTTLRLVAGLLHPDDGSILIDGAAVAGRMTRADRNRGCLEAPGLGTVWAYLQDDVRSRLSTGDRACISVRPMEVMLSKDRPDGEALNRFEGRIVQRAFLGELVEYGVQTQEVRWRAQTHSSKGFVPGDSVWLSFSHEAATMVLDA